MTKLEKKRDELVLKYIADMEAGPDRFFVTLAYCRGFDAALAELMPQVQKAYSLMRDAACLALDCDCTVDERLSGHKVTCQVPHIEFKINQADEALTEWQEYGGKE